jgi:cation/acetate symporter
MTIGAKICESLPFIGHLVFCIVCAGLFDVPLDFAVIIIVSLLTKAPGREIQELVKHMRYPSLDGTRSGASPAH